MGDVGSARYEPALLPPCQTIRILSYSNCQRSTHSISQWIFTNLALLRVKRSWRECQSYGLSCIIVVVEIDDIPASQGHIGASGLSIMMSLRLALLFCQVSYYSIPLESCGRDGEIHQKLNMVRFISRIVTVIQYRCNSNKVSHQPFLYTTEQASHW